MKLYIPPVEKGLWVMTLICFTAICTSGTSVWAGEGGWYPKGDVFTRLVADPKEPQNFMVVADLEPFEDADRVSAWFVGIGESFGLYRRSSQGKDDGWQVSVFAAAFSQFNLDGPSNDLINTDYQVGVPFSFRRGPFSLRARFFHQSSHLGDELLLGPNPPQRINLSFEAIDVLFAFKWNGWRPYAGGAYAVHVDPRELERGLYQAGIDYRHAKGWLGGIDVKWLEQRNWGPGSSAMVGYRFGPNRGPEGRAMSARLVYYDGVSPFGQFFVQDISYWGAGVWFQF
ncbi:MAG: DUF1207 domain-containing protein [Gammaproteobacteria bacterium]|nr:DUF1207 domain-containing protein [Gammaproteobacteria bacterium]